MKRVLQETLEEMSRDGTHCSVPSMPVEKVRDVEGLHLAPPEKTLVP